MSLKSILHQMSILVDPFVIDEEKKVYYLLTEQHCNPWKEISLELHGYTQKKLSEFRKTDKSL